MFKINLNAEGALLQIVWVIILTIIFMFIPVLIYSSEMDVKLLEAVQNDDVKLVKTMLDNGANVNTRDPFGNTPLIVAAKLGYVNCIQALIDRGAHIDS